MDDQHIIKVNLENRRNKKLRNLTDTGLRNARINFRQDEKPHLMENIIFNELLIRGGNVDVGVVPVVTKGEDGKQHRSQLEIDFVCNLGSKRYCPNALKTAR